MEDKRQTITLDDIKTYLLREASRTAIILAITTVCICLLLIALNFLFKLLIMNIITAIILLLGLIGTTKNIYNLKKIKNNTYFKTTTDVLVNKIEHILSGVWPTSEVVNRLVFKYNKYDFLKGSGYHVFYDMDIQAVFDTAFVGDTFTLVETKKSVVLAFNNKLFDVKVDY